MRTSLVGWFLAGAVLASSAPASAGLLVEESFDGTGYTPGALLAGLNGGTGWGAAWATTDSANYRQVIVSGGQAKVWAEGNGSVYQNASRAFSAAIADTGQTIWFAFQIGLNDSKNAGYWTLEGASANLFTLEDNAAPSHLKFLGTQVLTGDTDHTPHLVLVQVVMSGGAGNETATCYVDPNPAADPSTWTGTTKTTFNADSGLTGVHWYGVRANSTSFTSDVYLDGLRIATMWHEAAGLPEPATLALLGLGGLGLALARRHAGPAADAPPPRRRRQSPA